MPSDPTARELAVAVPLLLLSGGLFWYGGETEPFRWLTPTDTLLLVVLPTALAVLWLEWLAVWVFRAFRRRCHPVQAGAVAIVAASGLLVCSACVTFYLAEFWQCEAPCAVRELGGRP